MATSRNATDLKPMPPETEAIAMLRRASARLADIGYGRDESLINEIDYLVWRLRCEYHSTHSRVEAFDGEAERAS